MQLLTTVVKKVEKSVAKKEENTGLRKSLL